MEPFQQSRLRWRGPRCRCPPPWPACGDKGSQAPRAPRPPPTPRTSPTAARVPHRPPWLPRMVGPGPSRPGDGEARRNPPLPEGGDPHLSLLNDKPASTSPLPAFHNVQPHPAAREPHPTSHSTRWKKGRERSRPPFMKAWDVPLRGRGGGPCHCSRQAGEGRGIHFPQRGPGRSRAWGSSQRPGLVGP